MGRANNPLTQISSVNQTTTALANGGSFTGEWDVTPHEEMILQVKADTATDIYVDFSHDGGTTTHSTLTYVGAANVPTFSRLVKGARHFRVRVENNSGTNQTTLSVHVSCGSFGVGTTPLNLTAGRTADAIMVRSLPDGVDVPLGRVGGFESVIKWGHNSDIDTTTDPEDVWETGGLMNWPTAAAVCAVSSGSDADNGGTATGALTLTIEGLDANWDEQSETITLNGTGTVNTANSYIRINRAFVASVGTYHSANTGAITGTIGGSNMFTITAGTGQTQLGRYSVPNNRTFLLRQLDILVGSTKTATVKMWRAANANDVSDPFGGAKRIVREWETVAGDLREEFPVAQAFPAYTDIWFEVTEVAANDTSVTAVMHGILVDVS